MIHTGQRVMFPCTKGFTEFAILAQKGEEAFLVAYHENPIVGPWDYGPYRCAFGLWISTKFLCPEYVVAEVPLIDVIQIKLLLKDIASGGDFQFNEGWICSEYSEIVSELTEEVVRLRNFFEEEEKIEWEEDCD